MGAPRKKNRHLPPGMRQKGAYYYFDTGSAGRRAFGKRRQIPLGNDLTAALARWADLRGKPKAGSRIIESILGYIDYRQNLDRRRPRINKKTADEYRRLCGPDSKLTAVFADLSFDELEARDIDRFIENHRRPIIANRQVALLSGAWNYEKAQGRISSRDAQNPCTGIKRNQERKRKRTWALAEVALARAKATPQMCCIIDLALLTSLRKRDLLRLLLPDIKMPAGGQPGEMRARISKARAKDKIIIFEFDDGDALHEILARARRLKRRVSSFYLFAQRNGKPYTTSGFDSIWQRFMHNKVQIPGLWFHDLRRTKINRAKGQQGLEYAQQLAGHESITTTERYLSDIEAPRMRVVE